MEIDPAFRKSRQTAQQRQLRRLLERVVLFGIVPLAVLSLLWLLISGWRDADQGEVLVQAETQEVGLGVARSTAFLDIPGDPMILRLDTGDADGAERTVAGPAGLDTARFGAPRTDRFVVISEELIVQERRLMTALPSSREDFALFQARRSQSLSDGAPRLSLPVVEASAAPDTLGDLSDSWGAAIGGGGEGEEFTRTVIQNTTSIAVIRREADRKKLFDDAIVVIEEPRALADVLTSNGFDAERAVALAKGVARHLPVEGDLPDGAVVAMRRVPDLGGLRLIHLSLYHPEGYVGTVASAGGTRFRPASDPWLGDKLLARRGQVEDRRGTGGEAFRLLDAIYSAAIRSGVPTALVGELIVMMAQVHDLDGFASSGDLLTLIYSNREGELGAGQIAYIGIIGKAGRKDCYVIPDDAGGNFRCFDPRASGLASLGGRMMVTPVSGPVSSRFGPRKHPILKTVRDHLGIDWAAPTGTPVHAAADGTIKHAGDGMGYGNLIVIKHANGIETRYAHLDAFAPRGKTGGTVRAGDLIGFVGTTGRSTGPHLHFEVRVDGTPVDPMNYIGGGAQVSIAVEKLTDRIIRVESGGDPNARNPKSTATGLGQFIESTWLYMMRTYRPDLVRSMSRQDLLDLRTNPALSRQMVVNLARENEAYLRSKGHAVSPGRLYLAHFLGPKDADRVLAGDPELTVLELLGDGVVRANPFLRDYKLSDLTAWADRKMGGSARPVEVAAVVVPASVQRYKEEIDALLDAL